MSFDNDAINTYVNAANELRRLIESGASDGELLVAKMYMSIALADLVAANETAEVHANLVLLFMRSSNPQIYADMPPLEDEEETLPSTPLIEENEMDPVDVYADMPSLE
jgi:hypothetical protein